MSEKTVETKDRQLQFWYTDSLGRRRLKNNEDRQRLCIRCKKPFLPQSPSSKQKFCTRKCAYEFEKSQTLEYPCHHCKTPLRRVKSMIKPRMFCSRACSSKYTARPLKYKPFTCQHCKTTTEIHCQNKKKKYCSYVCNGLARRSSTRPNSARLAARLATWGRKVRKRDGHKCVRCGGRNKLQAHHRLSFAEYPNLRYEVDNGETLCIDCHAEEHPKIAHLIRSKLA